jgi:predicted  nucleic acid-binding Zn-ribbon protein
MFKKLMALLIIVSVLFTGTIVFAEGTTTSTAKAKITDKIKNFKDNVAEVKPLLDTISANRTQLAKLRTDGETAYKTTKKKLKDLLKAKDTLTPEQIEALKQDIATLTDDRNLIKTTIGAVEKESIDLRAAKKSKDIDAYKTSLNNIIAIQNTKIANWNKIIADLNKITEV